MKKIRALYFIVVITVCIFTYSLSLAGSPPAIGGMLPDIKLSMPKDTADKNYLGLGIFGFGFFNEGNSCQLVH